MSPRFADSARLLKFYVLAVTAGAVAALVLTWLSTGWDSSNLFLNGFIAILAVGLAAEISSVSLHVGSSILSIAFIPFLAATFLFPSAWAMGLGGVTVLFVEYVVRRKPWIKVVFNTAKEILAIGLASSAFQLLGGVPSVYQFSHAYGAMLAASVVYAATNSSTVCFAVSLAEGLDFSEAWGRMYGGAVLYDLFATPIPAFLAYLYVTHQLAGVVALTVPLFVVRHIYAQNLRLEQSNREMLELMVKQVELVEPYTSGHSKRVSQYARIIAKELGIHGKQVDQIATAALLHDVGKVYEEYAPLLRKEGKLTQEEKALLQSHPVRSAELVTTISSLRGSVELAVRHHHENYDGTGYPAGLSGQMIPIGARIIMVADTLDAMTTNRPYRRAMPFEAVVNEFRKHAGAQFDPRLVEIAVESAAIRRLVASILPEKPVPSIPRSMREPTSHVERAVAKR
jgi:putative nucleotidyltransferase with HDIG domain